MSGPMAETRWEGLAAVSMKGHVIGRVGQLFSPIINDALRANIPVTIITYDDLARYLLPELLCSVVNLKLLPLPPPASFCSFCQDRVSWWPLLDLCDPLRPLRLKRGAYTTAHRSDIVGLRVLSGNDLAGNHLFCSCKLQQVPWSNCGAVRTSPIPRSSFQILWQSLRATSPEPHSWKAWDSVYFDNAHSIRNPFSKRQWRVILFPFLEHIYHDICFCQIHTTRVVRALSPSVILQMYSTYCLLFTDMI